ncbi:orotate phosphoribosyltransferase [Candidatus Sumerlaeota bacterium]|nr:orotate phosphoribosyltransferase [Candidatus Sumerlaeota bacterium]
MPASDKILEALDPIVQKVLTDTGALLTGHFALTSGKHSALYFQAMRLLQHPGYGGMAAAAAAAHFEGLRVDATFVPAVGGIPWGYALASRFPDCRAIFAERVEGKMTLRRSFEIAPGEKILLAEDVTTTGGSVMELKALAEEAGADVIGLATVLDRSGGRFKPGVDHFAWARLDIEAWEPDDCPLCREGIPIDKPGSRGLSR